LGAIFRFSGKMALTLVLLPLIFSAMLPTPIVSAETNRAELLLRFKPGVGRRSSGALLRSLGACVVDEIPQISVLVISVPGRVAERVKSALARDPMVDFVEENRLIEPSLTPNDPYYSEQWHLPKIQAPDAWKISQGEPNIIIAILDTGIDQNHPDLSGKLLEGYNAYDDSNNVTDDVGHGTIVAGAASAITNNSLGIASIAWKNQILPIKVNIPGIGYTTVSLLAKGLTYAADKGAKVASMSWLIFNGSSTLTTAAKCFMEKGGLVIAAAGNTGKYESYTDNPYIISVAATDKSDLTASFSSSGPYVDISAPGVGIFTTIPGWQATNYKYAYGSASGTSLSTPIVAGLAALIFSTNPQLTPTQVEQILKMTADDLGELGYDVYYGWGRINAARALAAAISMSAPSPDTIPPDVAIMYPENGAVISGSVIVKVQASDNTAITKVELYINGTLFATDTEAPYEFYWDTTTNRNGAYTIQAKAYDKAGNISESSIIIIYVANSVKVIDTNPPTLKILQPQNGVTVSRTIDVVASAWDESGVSRVEFYVDGKLVATVSAEPYMYRWNTRSVRDGWHTITAKAYDKYGNAAKATVKVYVSNGKQPS